MLYLRVRRTAAVRYLNGGKLIVPKRGFVHPSRTLDHFVLLFGCTDRLEIAQNGRNRLLLPDRYLLLFPGVAHRGVAPSRPETSYCWLHFRFDPDDFQIIEHETDAPDGPGPEELCVPETGTLPSQERLSQLFYLLLDIAASLAGLTPRMCDHMTATLLMELFNQTQGFRYAQGEDASLANLKEWIRAHAADSPSVCDIARTFGYNPDYLSHKFKKSAGMSITAFLNRMRINKAKELLHGTRMTVCEIAYRCGFGDAKYFMRLFKRMEDQTPSQFRATFGRVHMNVE